MPVFPGMGQDDELGAGVGGRGDDLGDPGQRAVAAGSPEPHPLVPAGRKNHERSVRIESMGGDDAAPGGARDPQRVGARQPEDLEVGGLRTRHLEHVHVQGAGQADEVHAIGHPCEFARPAAAGVAAPRGEGQRTDAAHAQPHGVRRQTAQRHVARPVGHDQVPAARELGLDRGQRGAGARGFGDAHDHGPAS